MSEQARARLAALATDLESLQEQLREQAIRRAQAGDQDDVAALDASLAELRAKRQSLLDEQLLLERDLGLVTPPPAPPDDEPVPVPPEAESVTLPPPPAPAAPSEPVTSGRRTVQGARGRPPRMVRLLTLLAVLGGVGLLSLLLINVVVNRFLVPIGTGSPASNAELAMLGLEEREGLTLEQQAWRYLLINDREKLRPPSDDATLVPFTVPAGASATQIADSLASAGLIQDARTFVLLLRYRGADQSLAAGSFELRRNMTMDQVIVALQGGAAERVLTFPEGWRAEEMAALVEARELGTAEAYMALVRDPAHFAGDFDFLADLPEGATLEGFLFPDTYRAFVEGASAESVIRLQLETFGRRVTPALRAAATARGLSLYEALTIASIVEREAVVDEERPTIAGVYLNRIADGMLLNADPTIQYALGYQPEQQTWWKRPLSAEDLRLESPYNSYLVTGLPPTPIANPGLDAIRATINAPATEYYYFVSKNDGTHAFAVTLEEHQRNVDEFQSGE